MRNQFDSMLEELNAELIRMGALCEEAILTSTKLLLTGGESLQKVVTVEEEINSMERKIENMCMKLLLRQQPVARDLRQISSALKMISDMERIGDQALDIAELSKFINVGKKRYEKLELMANATIKMVTDATNSFVKKDLQLAGEVKKYDDKVDGFFVEIKNEVIENIRSSKKDGEYLADVLMAAKYYERIGDHSVNIAEWVEYSITGKHNQ